MDRFSGTLCRKSGGDLSFVSGERSQDFAHLLFGNLEYRECSPELGRNLIKLSG